MICIGLKFLVRICTDLGITKEMQQYNVKLNKLEEAKLEEETLMGRAEEVKKEPVKPDMESWSIKQEDSGNTKVSSASKKGSRVSFDLLGNVHFLMYMTLS